MGKINKKNLRKPDSKHYARFSKKSPKVDHKTSRWSRKYAGFSQPSFFIFSCRPPPAYFPPSSLAEDTFWMEVFIFQKILHTANFAIFSIFKFFSEFCKKTNQVTKDFLQKYHHLIGIPKQTFNLEGFGKFKFSTKLWLFLKPQFGMYLRNI